MSKARTGRLPERPHRYDDWPPQPYWPSFIEKLLLAIIDANRPAGTPNAGPGDPFRQECLERAVSALFGVQRSPGNDRRYDLPALIETARGKYRSASERAFEKQILGLKGAKLTKSPGLAKVAARHQNSVEGNSPEARSERLQKYLKQRPVHDYAQQVVLHGYHEEEDDMIRDLDEVARIFARWNLEMKVDAHRLGMASFWGPSTPE